jgi:CRISPR-associated protein Cmx8
MTNVSSPEQALMERVYSLVRSYVLRKTDAKLPIKWDDVKDKKVVDPATGRETLDIPQKYRDARESVCAVAFLRMRACRAREDFVAYFTGTLCSVPHYLPEKEYEIVAKAILDEQQWEEVKALAMLALSGLSRI